MAPLVSIKPGWLLVSLAGSAFATFVTAARWKLLSETMGARYKQQAGDREIPVVVLEPR